MRDNQKVYIKGDPNRGAEVIKALTDLGAINLNNLDGKYEKAYYYISPLGFIIEVTNYEENMMSILKEFYKEIKLPRWKPKYKEHYYRINWKGAVVETTWYDTQDERICYEFGNCFRTPEEARDASHKIEEMLNK